MFRKTQAPLRNVHTQVAERIGTSIVGGEVAPGEPLPSEMQICEMLDVSRTVVREAIRILTGKGLVESRAKSGTRVRPPQQWSQFDPDVLRWQLASSDVDGYLAKLFALRHAMEPAAAALAADAATDEDKRAIRDAVEVMAAARTNENYVRGDVAFHKSIFIATGNEFFWPMAQMFEVALLPSFKIAAPGDHRVRAVAEHRAVMEAIVSGNAAKATKVMLVLLEHSAGDLVRIRGRNPFKSISLGPAHKG
jgi:DNA-binding FadR family transcriptional regulator